MSTEENITVVQGSPNNLLLKPPRVYILVLIVIIILGTTAFLTLKNRLSKPETTQRREATTPASPSAQIQPAKTAKSEGGAGQKPNHSPAKLPELQNTIKPKPQ